MSIPDSRPGRGSTTGAGRRDRIAGFSIIGVAFLASLFISWKASRVAKSPVGPDTAVSAEAVPGYPRQVRPLAALARARSLSQRPHLRRILMRGVASDGTLDLEREQASVRYEFESEPMPRPSPDTSNASATRTRHCGRQMVHLRRQGIYAAKDHPKTRCSAERSSALPEPRCTLARLWEVAVERGADRQSLANVNYFRARGGPAWRFSLPGTSTRFTLLGDCQTELKGSEARPLLP